MTMPPVFFFMIGSKGQRFPHSATALTPAEVDEYYELWSRACIAHGGFARLDKGHRVVGVSKSGAKREMLEKALTAWPCGECAVCRRVVEFEAAHPGAAPPEGA